MTPEQRILAACIESGVDDLISPGILRNLVRSIEEACCAALRERDATHEIALKKARADALEEAAQEALRPNAWGSSADGSNIARRIRALLEEAGK